MSNIKTIPMSTEEIQELFMNQDSFYDIDLRNSKLQGEAFVTYIANMQMNCAIIDDPDLTSEQKFEILDYFLSFRQTIKCSTLLNTLSVLMFEFKGMRLVSNKSSWLSSDEIEKFIESRKEVLEKIAIFLESSLVFVPAFNNAYRKFIFEPAVEAGEIEVISDPDYVGVNVFGLFSLPTFIENFLATPAISSKLFYFEEQVEKMQYNRKTIFTLFMDLQDKSFFMALTNVFFSLGRKENELLEKYYPGSMKGVKSYDMDDSQKIIE